MTGRLGIWQLEGVEDYGTLLPYALSKENWASSMVVVVLDLSKPWTLEASALKWLGLVQQAWEALPLSPGERDELQEKGASRTRATRAVAGVPRAHGARGVRAAGRAGFAVRHYWRHYREPNKAGDDLDAKVDPPKPDDAAADVVLPLDPGVLTVNLGLPVMLLCLKVSRRPRVRHARAPEEGGPHAARWHPHANVARGDNAVRLGRFLAQAVRHWRAAAGLYPADAAPPRHAVYGARVEGPCRGQRRH